MSNSDRSKEILYAIDLNGSAWRKSPLSEGGENCIELTDLPGGAIAIRDSKNPEREPLRYTAEEWQAFRKGIIDGAL